MPVLKVNNLVKKFGGLTAVNNLTFSADKGEILGIIGPNGAGKTTVINLISGTFPATDGEIYFKEDEVTKLSPHTRNQMGISRTFQTVRPLEDFTALENIMIGALFGQKLSVKEAREKAIEVCDYIDLKNFNLPVDRLTVLELKQVELGRALVSQPDIIFLDEIMAGLNSEETWKMIELVKRLQERNIAICIVEHVMKVVAELTSRVIVLDRGQIIAQGVYEDVSREKEVISAYLGEEE
ncbi:MAG: ABC transporter ATP-binding protein [Bacillota bacterium]